jgi:hypothetical protein
VANLVTESGLLGLGQVPDTGVGVDAGSGQNLLGAGQADAINIGQANLNSLILGQVNARNTCHLSIHLLLTLSLLVLGILTNHHNSALALNDLAFLAHGLNGRSYFHRFTSCFAHVKGSLVQRASFTGT